MAIIFNQAVKHDRLEFLPGAPVAFEDKDAEPYFVALKWAEKTTKKPLRTYSKHEVAIDRDAVNADTGRKVLGG